MLLPPSSPTTPRIQTAYRQQIVAVLNQLVDAVVAKYDPSSRIPYDALALKGKNQKPLMYGLFPEVVRGSEIERSLSSRLGTVLQKVGKAVAESGGNTADHEVTVRGEVAPDVLEYIRKLVRPGRSTDNDRPDIRAEMQTIDGLNRGSMVDHSVKIDLRVETEEREYYFDLKTPSPNSDQPRDMKDRLMRARALRLPVAVDAYAVFYYNPGGIEAPYAAGGVYLDYKGGEVLVGRQFWDMLAGPGTYEEVLSLFAEVGQQRRQELLSLL
ncbi:MAG: TdeIII family type II restriction endonuclease [Dehalococcoidia bacterium]